MRASIIIATTERETLPWVLKAIAEQDGFDSESIEVLVIRDGLWQQKPEPMDGFVFLETEEKMYAAGARNLGIQVSKGERIIFINDDTAPEGAWLKYHLQASDILLGRVKWIKDLEKDRFHKWLEETAQFDYGSLDAGKKPNWCHFYTSNVSVSKKALNDVGYFNMGFEGWGFEDIELGYRLIEKHGCAIKYQPKAVVRHDDKQVPKKAWQRTAQARENAVYFESLHPGVKILPYGPKRKFLNAALIFSWPFQFIMEVRWWRKWKKAWLG